MIEVAAVLERAAEATRAVVRVLGLGIIVEETLPSLRRMAPEVLNPRCQGCPCAQECSFWGPMLGDGTSRLQPGCPGCPTCPGCVGE